MKTDELREKYLEFFVAKGHRLCPSDVLVPRWDKSVLFTPAGMNQFKDHFLGKIELEYTRATSCQKCLRTGDIENVGRTAFHHTFFEMLGNFSFGDYFKRDAIHWAWEFLTDPKYLAIDPARLSVTVYTDDDEAAAIWSDEIGVGNRLRREGEDENFWPASAPSQGPDGVCGPCSEIYYTPEGGEEVEIWNLVFTQFNRSGDPPDNLNPLPSKNIDTGMGLERIAATLQGVDTNYHIDTLRPIVEAAAEICGVAYDPQSDPGRRCRRITDHVRACTFCIHENVYPGAKKDEYIVKRLLRRAVLDGHQLGLREPFLNQLVPEVVRQMAGPYPELAETAERVAQVIRKEEQNFLDSIDDGIARTEKLIGETRARSQPQISGAAAAELYTTHGVPPELVETLGQQQQLDFDWAGFDQAMEEHGRSSGVLASTVMGGDGPIDQIKAQVKTTRFVGYEQTKLRTEVVGLVDKGCSQTVLQPRIGEDNEEIAKNPQVVVLSESPFYGESGGQVGDTGEIRTETGMFQVLDTQKDGDLLLHFGYVTSGEIHLGATVEAEVDDERRQAIRRAHSATHILHFALQQSLGSHAQQRGSKVSDDTLRFDFSNLEPVPSDTLQAVEAESNRRVAEAAEVLAQVVPLNEARQSGAMMLFGEKYPDPVRMVSIGEFSKELCGGTHVANTKDVLAFEITAEEGTASGTRRIHALTGVRAQQQQQATTAALQQAADALGISNSQVVESAERLMQILRGLKKRVDSGKTEGLASDETQIGIQNNQVNLATYPEIREQLRAAARVLGGAPLELPERIHSLLDEVQQLQQQLDKMSSGGAVSGDGLLASAGQVGGVTLVVSDVPGGNPNLLRGLIDQVRQKTDASAVFLLAAAGPSKVLLVAGLSKTLVDRGLSAGDWVKAVAPTVGGGGGGRPDMAQAGGKDPAQIPAAIEAAGNWIRQQLD